MINEAIEKILSLSKVGEVVEVDGRKYWAESGKSIEEPTMSKLAELSTLSGLVSYLVAPDGKGRINSECEQIVVYSHQHVAIKSTPIGPFQKRTSLVSAQSNIESFPFNRFLDRETFIIKAQCMFVDTPEKAQLIAFISNIVEEESIQVADDGITQRVTAKDGFRRSEAEMNPIVELRPFRTFCEVEQPASKFLLRMNKTKGGTEIALFEADGGAWKVTAAKNVAAYLREDETVKELGLAVIG